MFTFGSYVGTWHCYWLPFGTWATTLLPPTYFLLTLPFDPLGKWQVQIIKLIFFPIHLIAFIRLIRKFSSY
jgi:hypothetical protein